MISLGNRGSNQSHPSWDEGPATWIGRELSVLVLVVAAVDGVAGLGLAERKRNRAAAAVGES